MINVSNKQLFEMHRYKRDYYIGIYIKVFLIILVKILIVTYVLCLAESLE